jgi:hypothetical protein
MSRTQRLTLDFDTPAAIASYLTERPFDRRSSRTSWRCSVFITDNIAVTSDGRHHTHSLHTALLGRESARPGSNRCDDLGRVACYHYTTGAGSGRVPVALENLREADQIRAVDDPVAKLQMQAPACRRALGQDDAQMISGPDPEPARRRC